MKNGFAATENIPFSAPMMKDSRFFEMLLKRYARSPSIALCRVPELELLSRIRLEHPVLDHCCGDGFIAETAFPGAWMESGVDISPKQLRLARRRGNYRSLHQADAGENLPFSDGTFAAMINNSGLEHIGNLEKAISEISRVLKRGGTLYVTVLNSRYFERWPLPMETAEHYKKFQPFYHVMDEAEWREVLQRHAFDDVAFTDYLPEETSKVLARMDYRYSAFYFRQSFSASLLCERLLPKSWLIRKWRRLFENLPWQAQSGRGSGFLISAIKA